MTTLRGGWAMNISNCILESALATLGDRGGAADPPERLPGGGGGLPSTERGEQVTAVVVLAPRAGLDVPALEAQCRASLAGYKVLRRFEVTKQFLCSAAGKMLKVELRSSLAAQDQGR